MIDRSGSMTWFEGNGGPLLLLSHEYMRYWEGIRPPTDRNIRANFRWGYPNAPATDYDRACDVNDWLGLIEIDKGKGLVLGDEPLRTTWKPIETGEAVGMLIRWLYAENEEEVLEALRRVPHSIWEATGLMFIVGTEPLYLFDAACPGKELTDDERLIVNVNPGSYAVDTASYEPDDKTALILHRFVQIKV